MGRLRPPTPSLLMAGLNAAVWRAHEAADHRHHQDSGVNPMFCSLKRPKAKEQMQLLTNASCRAELDP